MAITARTVELAGWLGLDLLTTAPEQWKPAALRRLTATVDDLGGAVHKVAQILSTRPDVLGPGERAVLGRLCDTATPDPYSEVQRTLQIALSSAQRDLLADVDRSPIACGSVAQVHRARLVTDNRQIVLKVRRAGAGDRFRADLSIMTALARALSLLPRFAAYPVVSASAELATAILAQCDFAAERQTQRLFREAFAGQPEVLVPGIIDDLCGDGVIAMDLVENAVRIDAPDLDEKARTQALRAALRALYAMIFRHGLVHCDFHPGNLLVTPDGQVAVLDFGYTAAIPERGRRMLAKLLFAVTCHDAEGVAQLVADLAPAAVAPRTVARLAAELDPVLDGAAGATAGCFQLTRFAMELFDLQRRHGLRGDPAFTMAIVSLLSVEGLLKTYLPDLDFQREAIGYLAEALRTDGVRDRSTQLSGRATDVEP
ncbi:ABC1 kinase family protein [Amycolatopsis nivea]